MASRRIVKGSSRSSRRRSPARDHGSAPLAMHMQLQAVGTLRVAGDVEGHRLLTHAREVEIGGENARRLEHRAGEVRAVRRDDRAAAAEYPGFVAAHAV